MRVPEPAAFLVRSSLGLIAVSISPTNPGDPGPRDASDASDGTCGSLVLERRKNGAHSGGTGFRLRPPKLELPLALALRQSSL